MMELQCFIIIGLDSMESDIELDSDESLVHNIKSTW